MNRTPASPVVVFNPAMVKRPIYHLAGERTKTVDEKSRRRFEQYTLCGKPMEALEWNPATMAHHERSSWGTVMRTDHAELIGQPCKRCHKAS